ncbi:hypothetical protein, partial [Photobacterium halotolerans]|uniref:hypothetical protein n=1 Tax=Photobacterium halotolerans TaxID=265726 RepID=UPI00056A30B9
ACRNMDAEVIVARVRRYYGEDYGQGMLGYLKKHSENGFQPFFPGVTPQQAADDLDISENDANHLFAFLRLAGEII